MGAIEAVSSTMSHCGLLTAVKCARRGDRSFVDRKGRLLLSTARGDVKKEVVRGGGDPRTFGPEVWYTILVPGVMSHTARSKNDRLDLFESVRIWIFPLFEGSDGRIESARLT
jgi:hypothetical protein